MAGSNDGHRLVPTVQLEMGGWPELTGITQAGGGETRNRSSKP